MPDSDCDAEDEMDAVALTEADVEGEIVPDDVLLSVAGGVPVREPVREEVCEGVVLDVGLPLGVMEDVPVLDAVVVCVGRGVAPPGCAAPCAIPRKS